MLTIVKCNSLRLKVHLCLLKTVHFIKKNKLHEARISSLTPKIIHLNKNKLYPYITVKLVYFHLSVYKILNQ